MVPEATSPYHRLFASSLSFVIVDQHQPAMCSSKWPSGPWRGGLRQGPWLEAPASVYETTLEAGAPLPRQVARTAVGQLAGQEQADTTAGVKAASGVDARKSVAAGVQGSSVSGAL